MPHRQVSGAVAIHNLRHQNSPVRSPGHLPVLFHKQKIPGTIAIPGILVARGNNSNPLRLFAILLEKYPIDRLAGGAFAL